MSVFRKILNFVFFFFLLLLLLQYIEASDCNRETERGEGTGVASSVCACEWRFVCVLLVRCQPEIRPVFVKCLIIALL